MGKDVSWFGERVLAALDRRGMSQSELARRIGMDPSHLNKWLNRKTDPRVPWDTLVSIADALDVELGSLLPPQEAKRLRDRMRGGNVYEVTPGNERTALSHKMLLILAHLETSVEKLRREISNLREIVLEQIDKAENMDQKL